MVDPSCLWRGRAERAVAVALAAAGCSGRLKSEVQSPRISLTKLATSVSLESCRVKKG